MLILNFYVFFTFTLYIDCMWEGAYFPWEVYVFFKADCKTFTYIYIMLEGVFYTSR